jgi:proline iminopeptidase
MIYLDQRGAGRSERPWNDAYSLSLLVEDIEALRRRLGVDRLNLIGHSFGTIIAMEYGARYPKHVERMVLAASGPDLPDAFNRMCDRVARTDPAAYARAVAAVEPGSQRRCNMWGDGVFKAGGMQRFVNGNMFPKSETEALINQADRANGLRNRGELSNALIRQGVLDYRFTQTSALRMPVLVIAGERDLQAGIEPQREFVAKVPSARMLAYDQGGHFMWAEEPERFARDVISFLTSPR